MKAFTITAVIAGLATSAAWASAYNFAGSWGARGAGDGQFYMPQGISIAPNGNVYVTDTQNHRVQYFSPEGSFRGKWGSAGSGA